MPSKIVTNPDHYNAGKIECITYLRDSLGVEGFMYHCEGTVKKYMHRWRYKNGLEDLEKAQWYLDVLIKECIAQQEKDSNGHTTTEDDCDGSSSGHEVSFKSRRDDGDV
jgi:hypothetical protein